MTILNQLITPLGYLRIRQEVKPWFDWYAPFFITSTMVLAFYALPISVNIFGDNGLVFIITDLIKFLAGFYIASLAAVATFHKPEMDEPLAGSAATLDVIRRGGDKKSILSRRRFLCYLFGYLAFMSLALYFVGAAVSLLWENLSVLAQYSWAQFAKWLFIYVYLFFTVNLLTTTLLGLHFMTDRIHR